MSPARRQDVTVVTFWQVQELSRWSLLRPKHAAHSVCRIQIAYSVARALDLRFQGGTNSVSWTPATLGNHRSEDEIRVAARWYAAPAPTRRTPTRRELESSPVLSRRRGCADRARLPGTVIQTPGNAPLEGCTVNNGTELLWQTLRSQAPIARETRRVR